MIQTKNKRFLLTLIFSVSVVFCFVYSAELSDSATFYYTKAEYKKAARCYEKIISSGKESWMLYYNLGNCYYEDGRIGLAILNYEKAKKINPTQEDLLNNLSIAENKITDKIKTREISIEKEIKNFFIYRFSTTGWAWCSIITFGIALTLFFVFYIGRNSITNRISFWSGIITIVIFGVSLLFGYAELNEKSSAQSGIIISSETKVYNKPKLEASSQKNLVLHEGTRFKILEIEDEWINIQLINGNEGWILTKDTGIY
jgi:tetratricopeptide (TPR) repeat protein